MNHNPSTNPNGERRLSRAVEELRSRTVDDGKASAVAVKMLAARPRHDATIRTLRLATAAAVVALLGGAALWPRRSSAATLREVVDATNALPARYEQVYKPGPSGMHMYLEIWSEPGKYAERFDDGNESRENGRLAYSYWPKEHYQRIIQGEAMGIDPVGIAAYEQFKIVRIVDHGSTQRYVLAIGQDIIVDRASKLPLERIVYNPDHSIMEIHEYHFYRDLDDRVFEPDVKPGIPLYDIPADKSKLAEMVSRQPQVCRVEGIEVSLYAVIVDRVGNVGAIVSGGDPRSYRRGNPLQIAGLPPGWQSVDGKYTTLAGTYLSKADDLIVAGKQARFDKVTFASSTQIPEHFKLRIPVWKYDKNLPILVRGHRIGTDSRLVGWAEFDVSSPLRTESVDQLLPNFVPPSGETGSATVGRASAR